MAGRWWPWDARPARWQGCLSAQEMWVIFPIYNPCPTVKIAICSFLRKPLVSSWLLILIFPLLWWGYTSHKQNQWVYRIKIGSSPTCQDSSGDESGTSAYGGSNQVIRSWFCGGGFANDLEALFPEIVWKNSLTPWLMGWCLIWFSNIKNVHPPKFLTWKPKIGGLVCRCFSFSREYSLSIRRFHLSFQGCK